MFTVATTNQDDEELKKDSKIRRTKTTIRLRKRKKIPRRSSTVVDGKHTKLPSIMQDQTVKKRAITPEVFKIPP